MDREKETHVYSQAADTSVTWAIETDAARDVNTTRGSFLANSSEFDRERGMFSLSVSESVSVSSAAP